MVLPSEDKDKDDNIYHRESKRNNKMVGPMLGHIGELRSSEWRADGAKSLSNKLRVSIQIRCYLAHDA